MTLLPAPSASRVPQTHVLFSLFLALVLIFALAIGVAIPANADIVEPLAISVSLDKTAITAGEGLTASWTASGGRAPYSYTYIWDVRSGGYYFEKKRQTVSEDITSASFIPEMGESGYVSVYVKDADGRTTSHSQYFQITGFEVVPPP